LGLGGVEVEAREMTEELQGRQEGEVVGLELSGDRVEV